MITIMDSLVITGKQWLGLRLIKELIQYTKKEENGTLPQIIMLQGEDTLLMPLRLKEVLITDLYFRRILASRVNGYDFNEGNNAYAGIMGKTIDAIAIQEEVIVLDIKC